ncbi:SMP-30/gluconolactonase/LRE family protein [Nodosilinea sp. LEGE 07298]|uniref:SMP-30/gluconolactonase/LRE family protein n=1 Tax=Nodosilinea sp. LEGE 07298 TaxID=2777970 RepID=UPI00187EAA3C|nr:SMP-30/gluconolactonase/LRE family protein [Nodosilinea sp. LEGE 07298]MBE9108766.1 SMP-30/gluconolactonase/LRE family protein [Nodosilinea sp. LEGE 07298]
MAANIEIFDDRLKELVYPDADLEQLASGVVHSEGPVYCPEDGSVVFSEGHGNRLLCWHEDKGVQVLRDPSHYQNGNTLDLEGRLVACSHGQRAIIRREQDGQWVILVDRYQGKRLNSPNDLVIKSDGTIWFTDPPYGITQPGQGYGGKMEQPSSFVFRFDPATTEIEPVVTEMERPNGLAFSPDERQLYVSDTSEVDYPQGHHYIRVYDVLAGRQATNGRVFAVVDPGQPDGFRVDAQGNIFTSSQDSVQVFAPDSVLLGKIYVPETVTNLTFGGPEGHCLLITAGESLYRIRVKTRGLVHVRNGGKS